MWGFTNTKSLPWGGAFSASLQTVIYSVPVSKPTYPHGALTLRPPTNQPHDIPTHTIRPPNILSTVTIFYCDTLTMWHFLLWQFSTATLRPCDIFLLWHSNSVTIFYCNTSTMWHFSTVTFRLCDNFYCDILSQSGRIVRSPQKVDGLSHCDIPTHCNFGQPMAVTFCPLWILISPVDTLSKLLPILTDDDLVTLSL